MPGAKLLSLLSAFSAADCAGFERFLRSPFFNENENLLQLFTAISKDTTNRSPNSLQQNQQLDKRLVWKKIYGKEAYDDSRLRRLSSDLLQLAYQYQSVTHYLSTEEEGLLALLNQTQDPTMEKHFRGLSRKFDRLQQASERPSAQHYRQLYQYYLAQHRQCEARGEKLEHFGHLERADYYLECWYALNKLKHYCDALGYENFMALKPQIAVPDDFLDDLSRKPQLHQEPWLRAYYFAARMLSEEDGEPWFYELKRLLFDAVEALPVEEAKVLCIHLSNFCIDKKINVGNAAFFHELFEVYKSAIEAGLLFKNDLLSHQDYKNIISVGLHIKAFDWVEYFIQHYTQRLPIEHRENALTYNLAKVYFHQEQYDKVIEQLREVEYPAQVYALGSKLLLLLTYFEMGEFLALDSLLESFRIYLRRNRQLSREVKQQYLNVIRFTRRLSRISPGDKAALARLEQQIKDCKDLASRQWLEGKVAELQ